MTYDRSYSGEQPDFHEVVKYGFKDLYKVVIIINGKNVVLDKADVEKIITKKLKGGTPLDIIFKDAHSGAKRSLTRIRNGKEIIKWLADNLTGISQSERDALNAASAQMK
jgi:hypothetical protein